MDRDKRPTVISGDDVYGIGFKAGVICVWYGFQSRSHLSMVWVSKQESFVYGMGFKAGVICVWYGFQSRSHLSMVWVSKQESFVYGMGFKAGVIYNLYLLFSVSLLVKLRQSLYLHREKKLKITLLH